MQKYGGIDANDIRVKMDAVNQEPKERVQRYFERLDKLFQKGQIQDAKQRRRFLARLRPEIRKLCVVRVFADIEELVSVAIEVERVLGELGETPLEPLKEEKEEGTEETIMEKQVTALNETLVNFFKGVVSNQEASSSSMVIGGCQICQGGDHLATACPRLMKHGRNVQSAGCHIGQKIAESSVPTAQVWDIPKTSAGRSPKMENHLLG